MASSAERFLRAGGAWVYEESGGSGAVLSHEALLEEYLQGIRFSSERRLGDLVRAMRLPLLADGEGRVYGLACMEAACDLGLEAKEVLPAAGAVEFAHIISMIHDALPALGRGVPELESYLEDVDQATAILAGDGFWGEALGLLTREQRGAPERVLRAVQELALATGTGGMVGGQSVGLRGVAERPEDVYRLKWGALFRASARMGAALAGGTERELDALGRCAWYAGVCQRISLELDGLIPTEERVFTGMLGRDGALELSGEARRSALAALEDSGIEARGMRGFLEYVVGVPRRKEG